MARPGRPWESASAWWLILAAVGLAISSAQSVLRAELGWSVDVLPVLVLYVALELDLEPGALLTTFIGVCADGLSGAPPGLFAAGLMGSFLLIRVVVRRPPPRVAPVIVALTGLGVLGAVVTRWAVVSALGGGFAPVEPRLGTWLLTLGLSFPLYAALQWVCSPVRPRDDIGTGRSVGR